MTETQEQANGRLDNYYLILDEELKKIDNIFITYLKKQEYPRVDDIVKMLLHNATGYSNTATIEDFYKYYQFLYAVYYKVFSENLPIIEINKNIDYPTKDEFAKKLEAYIPKKYDELETLYISITLKDYIVPHPFLTITYDGQPITNDGKIIDGKERSKERSKQKSKNKRSKNKRSKKEKLKMKYII